jgi:hypothetical protein
LILSCPSIRSNQGSSAEIRVSRSIGWYAFGADLRQRSGPRVVAPMRDVTSGSLKLDINSVMASSGLQNELVARISVRAT